MDDQELIRQFDQLASEIEDLLDNNQYKECREKYKQMFKLFRLDQDRILDEKRMGRLNTIANRDIVMWAKQLPKATIPRVIETKEKIQELSDTRIEFDDNTIEAVETYCPRMAQYMKESQTFAEDNLTLGLRDHLNDLAVEIQENVIVMMQGEYMATPDTYATIRHLKQMGDQLTLPHPELFVIWHQWCQNPLQQYGF
tara:strand:- start:136 stop:729 length:594 start_codon:yes stop_codon:yes gene_type:complete